MRSSDLFPTFDPARLNEKAQRAVTAKGMLRKKLRFPDPARRILQSDFSNCFLSETALQVRVEAIELVHGVLLALAMVRRPAQ